MPGGVLWALSRIFSLISAMERTAAGLRSMLSSFLAREKRCKCASLKPGNNAPPSQSITLVPAPTTESSSSWLPTYEMLSPSTATIWANGPAASMVITRVFFRTISAVGILPLAQNGFLPVYYDIRFPAKAAVTEGEPMDKEQRIRNLVDW